MTVDREQTLIELISQQQTVGRPLFGGKNCYSYNGKNRYAIYSVGVDRFILLDGWDLWITLSCAKILSSKLPTIVFALGDEVDQTITQDDCIFWTISNKNITLSNSQTPVLQRLTDANAIVREGAPLDYVTDEQIQILIDLQNYALFVQKTLYAIRLADAMTNSDDHFFFAKLIEGNISDILQVRGDHTQQANGCVLEIERVLYTAQSIDEAMSRIDVIWQKVNRFDSEFRTRFYNMLEMPEPDLARAVLPKI